MLSGTVPSQQSICRSKGNAGRSSRHIQKTLTIFIVWGYNVETILAEKAETILSRGITNTRARDFYDIYILVKEQKYDTAVFYDALRATSEHRNSWNRIKNQNLIIEQIERSTALENLWKKYSRTFHYAKDISFQDTIKALRQLLS